MRTVNGGTVKAFKVKGADFSVEIMGPKFSTHPTRAISHYYAQKPGTKTEITVWNVAEGRRSSQLKIGVAQYKTVDSLESSNYRHYDDGQLPEKYVDLARQLVKIYNKVWKKEIDDGEVPLLLEGKLNASGALEVKQEQITSLVNKALYAEGKQKAAFVLLDLKGRYVSSHKTMGTALVARKEQNGQANLYQKKDSVYIQVP